MFGKKASAEAAVDFSQKITEISDIQILLSTIAMKPPMIFGYNECVTDMQGIILQMGVVKHKVSF